jgi:predicted nucleotide-binding protein
MHMIPAIMKTIFPITKVPQRAAWIELVFDKAFIGSSVEAAASNLTCSVLDSYRTELIWLNCRQTESIRR